MSFDLRISFEGATMFVPQNGERMHVLLPSIPGQSPGHVARIAYDTAYESPGNLQLSGTLRLIEVDSRVLDLTGLATQEGFDPRLPPEILSLDGMVPPDLLSEAPNGQMAPRVTLDAGVLTAHARPAFSFFPAAGGGIGAGMEWTIRGITSAALPGRVLRARDGAPEVRLPDLHPIGQTVQLTVINTPPANQSPDDRHSSAVSDDDHFSAYYTLLSPPRRP